MSPFEVIQRAPSPTRALRGAVITLVFNRVDNVVECLHSLREHLPSDIAVIVVDNASNESITPPVAPQFPEVHFLRASENRGFAGGNNVGAALAFELGAPLIYLLNDDTVVTPRFWEECEEAMIHRGTAIAGSILVNFAEPDVMQIAGVYFDFKRLKQRYVGIGKRYTPEWHGYRSCDAVWGAGCMIRGDIYAQFGGLDEAFFHLWEELDFCLRVRLAGNEVGYVGTSVIRHKGGGSMQNSRPRWVFFNRRNEIWMHARVGGFFVFWFYAPIRAFAHLGHEIRHGNRLRWPLYVAEFLGILVGLFTRRRRRLVQFPVAPPPFSAAPRPVKK